VNKILKEGWFALSDEDKKIWKGWEQWDAKRYAHDAFIFANGKARSDSKEYTEESNGVEADALQAVHVPKKRKIRVDADASSHRDPLSSIPKKSRY
jgi:hypothetical protein